MKYASGTNRGTITDRDRIARSEHHHSLVRLYNPVAYVLHARKNRKPIHSIRVKLHLSQRIARRNGTRLHLNHKITFCICLTYTDVRKKILLTPTSKKPTTKTIAPLDNDLLRRLSSYAHAPLHFPFDKDYRPAPTTTQS